MKKKVLRDILKVKRYLSVENRRMRINIAVTRDELDSFGSGGGF